MQPHTQWEALTDLQPQLELKLICFEGQEKNYVENNFFPCYPASECVPFQTYNFKLVAHMNTEDLYQSTLEMLQNRSARIMLKQIAGEAQVGYSWLCAFHQGRIKEEYKHPKVEAKIKKLNAYLLSKLSSV